MSVNQLDWCSTTLYQTAVGNLCNDPNNAAYCPDGIDPGCAAVTSSIQNNCGLFQPDQQINVQIRTAAQCIDGSWIGGCQGAIPCASAPVGMVISPWAIAGIGAVLIGGGLLLAATDSPGGRLF